MFSRDKLRYEPVALPDRVDLAPAEMEEAAAAFLNIMRRRHTVRDFSPEAVPQDVIEACVATAGRPARPTGIGKADHDPCRRQAGRRCHGTGSGKDQEAARGNPLRDLGSGRAACCIPQDDLAFRIPRLFVWLVCRS